jgi:hypothetical protein
MMELEYLLFDRIYPSQDFAKSSPDTGYARPRFFPAQPFHFWLRSRCSRKIGGTNTERGVPMAAPKVPAVRV